MKHIKSINEYNRTAGFRYSDPNIELEVVCSYDEYGDKLTTDKVDKALSNIYELKFSNVRVSSNKIDLSPMANYREEEPETNEEPDGKIEFSMSVYNEKEIMKIMEDFARIMNSQFDVKIYDWSIKDKKVM